VSDRIVKTPAERAANVRHKMTPGTLHGRSDIATPSTPIFIQRPTVFPFFPVSACFTESFTAADATGNLDADLSWLIYAYARAQNSTTGATTQIDTEDDADLVSTGRISSNRATIFKPEAADLPASRDQWIRTSMQALADPAVGLDQSVSLTIEVPPLGGVDTPDVFSGNAWMCMLRMAEIPGGDGFTAGDWQGIECNFGTDPGFGVFVYIQLWYDLGGGQAYTFGDGADSLGPDLVTGDVVAARVTGTPGAETVVLSVNGSDIFTYGPLPVTVDGTQSGFGLFGFAPDKTGPGTMEWTSAMNDQIAISDFTACAL